MKNLSLTFTAIFLFGLSSHAEMYTAEQGLNKIKTNLENAKANKQDYTNNLATVNKNIQEITQAKNQVLQQKNTVSQEIVNNNESLKKVILQEKEIQMLLNQEQQKYNLETKQVEQLEALIKKIKDNQALRQANINDYQNQLQIATQEKDSWKSRESELRAQENKTIQSLRGLASEEATWMNKKKIYENEEKRWAIETEKHQKINDTHQGLKEN